MTERIARASEIKFTKTENMSLFKASALSNTEVVRTAKLQATGCNLLWPVSNFISLWPVSIILSLRLKNLNLATFRLNRMLQESSRPPRAKMSTHRRSRLAWRLRDTRNSKVGEAIEATALRVEALRPGNIFARHPAARWGRRKILTICVARSTKTKAVIVGINNRRCLGAGVLATQAHLAILGPG
jgi:hypothetical protein